MSANSMDEVNTILRKLAEPFPFNRISWRVGSTTKDKKKGQALPYINARCVQDRFDEVVGPGGWCVEFKASPVGNGMVAKIGILVNGQWVYKEDGSQLDSVKSDDSRANAAEIAVKGAYSDAFKRSAVMWGIGRYLYAYAPEWVELDDYKALKRIPKMPAAMLPENEKHLAKSTQNSQGNPAYEGAASKPAETKAASTNTAAVTKQAEPPKADKQKEPAQSGTDYSADPDYPKNLDGAQVTKLNEILAKLPNTPVSTVKSFLSGEAAKKMLGESGVEFVNKKIADIEKKAA